MYIFSVSVISTPWPRQRGWGGDRSWEEAWTPGPARYPTFRADLCPPLEPSPGRQTTSTRALSGWEEEEGEEEGPCTDLPSIPADSRTSRSPVLGAADISRVPGEYYRWLMTVIVVVVGPVKTSICLFIWNTKTSDLLLSLVIRILQFHVLVVLIVVVVVAVMIGEW